MRAPRVLPLVAGSPLLAWRRAVADRGLVAVCLALVAVTAFLALAGPRYLVESADRGVRQAVTEAGSRGDVLAELPLDTLRETRRDQRMADKLESAANDVRAALPDALRAAVLEPELSFSSTDLRLAVPPETGLWALRLQWVWSERSAGVRWVEGAEPGPSPDARAELAAARDVAAGDTTAEPPPQRVEVGVTRATADVLGVSVGSELALDGAVRGEAVAVVTGIFEPVDPDGDVWAGTPELLEPVVREAKRGDHTTTGLLLSRESVADARSALQGAGQRTVVRFAVDAASLTAARAAEVGDDAASISANPDRLTLAGGSTPAVSTGLDEVLGEFATRLRGVTAQASLLLVGIVTVAGLALVLAARLLVTRRRTLLEAERARGASVASVALRLGLESVPVTLAGLALGLLAALLATPASTTWSWVPAIAVAVVATLATPVLGAALVARAWTGRQLPANRQDRERVLGRRRAQRRTAEATVVLLAAGATSAVRGRGLLQTQTAGVDLLLAATPALLAAGATILVLRAFPVVLGAVGRLAARRRGLVGVVAAARAAQAAGLGVPLLSLTVALALVVFAGLTAVSVGVGQERASIEQVGADVLVEGAVDRALADAVLAQDGVDAAALGTVIDSRRLNGDGGEVVTLVALEAAPYARVRAAVDPRYDGELAGLDATGPDGPRALVSPPLLAETDVAGARVYDGEQRVTLDTVGGTSFTYGTDPVVLVDLATYDAATELELVPTSLWVSGPGAPAAVDRAVEEVGAVDVTVTARADRLAAERSSALVRALQQLLLLTSLVLALFAAVTLVLTVVATAPERGRTLSALRTLGLDARGARLVTLGELSPLVGAAVLSGAAIGVAVPVVLTGAFGLSRVTGELGTTELAVTPLPFALAVGVAVLALLVSVVAEAAVRRRDRLGDVLRVGDR
ncbi:FtsX-like permease family protein [Cellulomonas cellasea]|uniref:Putative ABC transport system permease protein n=1 Tax=Cellulomonas cellasea TaxID=43670 RepID=A0A7W4UGU1_9CELL|nr:FtsX-like permease family protein [Cellulomonas cellasea]MBB2923907.1 putative ABC transport system permease protein [Cellulomonas cellasea]